MIKHGVIIRALLYLLPKQAGGTSQIQVNPIQLSQQMDLPVHSQKLVGNLLLCFPVDSPGRVTAKHSLEPQGQRHRYRSAGSEGNCWARK